MRTDDRERDVILQRVVFPGESASVRAARMGKQLLRTAVGYWDVDNYVSNEQVVRNQGTGGSALDAQFGSSAGVTLPYNGVPYVYLPGVTGNYLSVPDAAALDITGDIEFEFWVSMASWTPGATSFLLAKRQVAGQGSYRVYISATGYPTLDGYADGTTGPIGIASSAAVPFAAGATGGIKVTWRASDGRTQFFTATNQSSPTWVQLGTDVTAAVGSWYSSTSQVEIGSQLAGTNGLFGGNVYRAIVRSGIGGSTVLDVDTSVLTSETQTTFTATTGQTVTINKTAPGTNQAINVVRAGLWGGGVDSNDPQYLAYSGTPYVYLPGVAGNYLSVPDAANLRISGDLEIVCRLALPDWTPSSFGTLVARWGYTTNESYIFLIKSGGQLQLSVSSTGTTQSDAISTVAIPFIDGTIGWVKATWRASDGRTQFFTAADQATEPSSWTQLGADRTANVGSLFAGTMPLEVGAYTSGTWNPLTGNVYRAIVRNGIGGTTVLDVDTSVLTSGSAASFTAVTGQTVTINRSSSGRKAVAVVRPVMLFGTDDYLQVADNDLLDFGATEPFSVLACVRQFATIPSNGAIVSKENIGSYPGAAGWQLYNGGTTTASKWLMSDGTTGVFMTSSSTPAAGAVNLMTGIRDVDADVLRAFNNSTAGGTTSDTTTGSLANSGVMRIGCSSGTAASYNDMEFLFAAVFRRALSASEISLLATYAASRMP